MKLIRLNIVLAAGLFFCLPGFSQTMSNTDNVITLSNTCFNAGVINGTYNLDLNYYDLDLATSIPVTISGVTVAVSNGVMTITAPSGSFPSTATRGWSLSDAYPGHIQLTSGSFITYMTFFLNPDGVTDGFNCTPLPVWFNSFTGSASGGQVTLHWQTGLEQNSTYIEIWRYSGGSGGYYKIGQVTAAGNSSIPVNYTFTDTHPCSSNTYYLKMLNSQGTLPIFSGYLPVGCSSCTCSLPSPVYCNFIINGPDLMCNQGTPAAYSLSSPVPNFSSIAWSVDQPSAVYLRTFPDDDPAKATLLKKSGSASVTLSATMSGCTNVISRTVTLGAPAPGIFPDVECPNLLCIPLGATGATSYNWTLYNYTVTGVSYGSGSEFDPFIGDGSDYQVSLSYTNACGTSPTMQVGTFNCPPGTSTRVQGAAASRNPGTLAPVPGSMVWPNPTNGLLTVTLPAQNTSNTQAAPAAKSRIYMIKVLDVQGVAQKMYSYPDGPEHVSLDLSALNNGVYILQVFDNKSWKPVKVILAK